MARNRNRNRDTNKAHGGRVTEAARQSARRVPRRKGARGGKPPVLKAEGRAARDDAERAVASVFQSLLEQGAPALLAGDV